MVSVFAKVETKWTLWCIRWLSSFWKLKSLMLLNFIRLSRVASTKLSNCIGPYTFESYQGWSFCKVPLEFCKYYSSFLSLALWTMKNLSWRKTLSLIPIAVSFWSSMPIALTFSCSPENYHSSIFPPSLLPHQDECSSKPGTEGAKVYLSIFTQGHLYQKPIPISQSSSPFLPSGSCTCISTTPTWLTILSAPFSITLQIIFSQGAWHDSCSRVHYGHQSWKFFQQTFWECNEVYKAKHTNTK